MGNVTTEQQPAEHGRGAGEDYVPHMLSQIRRFVNGVVRSTLLDLSNGIDSPGTTTNAAQSVVHLDAINSLLTSLESLNQQKEAAIAALTQPKGDARVDSEVVLAALRKHIDDNFTSQLAFAQSLRVSASYVSDVLNRRREIPPDWVFSIGFQKAGWERIEDALSLPRQSEAVAYRWTHPDGDCGSWTDIDMLTPEYKAKLEADGATFQYSYLATPQPAQADTTPAAHGVGDGMVVVPRELSNKVERALYRFGADELSMRECWNQIIDGQAASAPGGSTNEELK